MSVRTLAGRRPVATKLTDCVQKTQESDRSGECYNGAMKIKVIVHDAEEGGLWAEVPAIPGCATQGETLEELIRNLHEAIEGCLSVDVYIPLHA